MGSSAPIPQYQPPADDPEYLALKQQAEQDKTAALQVRAGMDSAALMARYGSRLAVRAGGGLVAHGAAPGSAAAPFAMPDLATMFPALATPKVA